MPDRLKGSVSFGRTISTGNFSSVRIDFMQEFYLEEKTHGEVLPELQKRVDGALSNAAIAAPVRNNAGTNEVALRLELKLDGKPFPVRGKDPAAKFELEKNREGQVVAVIWRNLDGEGEEKDLEDALNWSLRKVKEKRATSQT